MIYLDKNFICHSEPLEGTRAVECDFFVNRPCEGHRMVPDGESWERSDGVVFQGEMIAPISE